MQVIDWGVVCKTPERFVVIPNEYLGQWTGRRLRVSQPQFSGGPDARGSDKVLQLATVALASGPDLCWHVMMTWQVVGMQKEGRAIVYDSDFTSVLALPMGVRARVLHHTVTVDEGAKTYMCAYRYTPTD